MQENDSQVISRTCNHLDSTNRENNIICLHCANSRSKLQTSHCEESLELINSSSKSNFYIVILFTVSILLVAGLYIHAIIITDEYVNTLILAKKTTNQGVLPQLQIFSAIALICSAIVAGYLCFSDDYSAKVQGWAVVGLSFVAVCALNLFIAFDQWINKYQ